MEGIGGEKELMEAVQHQTRPPGSGRDVVQEALCIQIQLLMGAMTSSCYGSSKTPVWGYEFISTDRYGGPSPLSRGEVFMISALARKHFIPQA